MSDLDYVHKEYMNQIQNGLVYEKILGTGNPGLRSSIIEYARSQIRDANTGVQGKIAKKRLKDLANTVGPSLGVDSKTLYKAWTNAISSGRVQDTGSLLRLPSVPTVDPLLQ